MQDDDLAEKVTDVGELEAHADLEAALQAETKAAKEKEDLEVKNKEQEDQ